MAPSRVRDWRVWWLGGAALIVVVLSSRRAVWAAMVVALLVGLLVARDRARLVLRGLGVVAAILIALAVFAPSVLGEIGQQLATVWGATQGSAADNSTQGTSATCRSVQPCSPTRSAGLGAGAHLPGLVVESPGSLYIHNQILESWLRFGIVGAALVIAVQATLISAGGRAAAATRRRPHGQLGRGALIMAPVAMLTAPFFTANQRWPAVLGLAGGLVAGRQSPPPVSFGRRRAS